MDNIEREDYTPKFIESPFTQTEGIKKLVEAQMKYMEGCTAVPKSKFNKPKNKMKKFKEFLKVAVITFLDLVAFSVVVGFFLTLSRVLQVLLGPVVALLIMLALLALVVAGFVCYEKYKTKE